MAQRRFCSWSSQALEWACKYSPETKLVNTSQSNETEIQIFLVTCKSDQNVLVSPSPSLAAPLPHLSALCLFHGLEFSTNWSGAVLVQSFLGSRKGGGLFQGFHRETSRNQFNTISLMFSISRHSTNCLQLQKHAWFRDTLCGWLIHQDFRLTHTKKM